MKLSLPVLCSCCMLVIIKKTEKNDVLYFSAHGTRSGIIVWYFPRVEHDLALLYYILRTWNAL